MSLQKGTTEVSPGNNMVSLSEEKAFYIELVIPFLAEQMHEAQERLQAIDQELSDRGQDGRQSRD